MLSNNPGFKALARTYISNSRWYYTRSKQTNSGSLYARISPLGDPNVNVTPELDKWVEEGNKIRFAELQRIILDLRRRRRFSQALQVSQWMRRRDSFTFTPVQHAVQLDLVGKVNGFQTAESYFNSLNEQDKTDKVYGALLHCYVRQCENEKAIAFMQKMEEKGLISTSVAYNDIMSLHFKNGEYEKIPHVFYKMKGMGVKPDNFSYRICMNSYGMLSDIEGLERILNEMEKESHIIMDWNTYAVVANIYIKGDLIDKANISLKKAEVLLDDKDGLAYNHLISLHARLGNRDDVLRLWALEKYACKRLLNKDFISMMESLVRLGELELAKRILKEWESSGNCYDFRVPYVIIDGYIEKGLCQKAEELLEDLMEAGKATTSNIWGRLAAAYLEKSEIEKAIQSLKVALSLDDSSKRSKLSDNVVERILSVLGMKGSSSDAEKVITLLKSTMPLTRPMYHALLKSYIIVGKEVDRLLDIMKADQFEEDEETLNILNPKQNLIENFGEL